VDFKGQQRRNDTHASTTDADPRLFKKSQGDKSRLCHMGHILMENRNGLIVDVEITYASGSAEREAALAMLGRRDNKDKHSAVDGRIKRHAGYRQSLRIRKRIEEAFGWIKTVGGLASARSSLVMPSSRAKRCCALPPTTWCARAAWAAGGTHIMCEPWDTYARNGRNGLQTGQIDRRNRCPDASARLVSSKPASLVRSKCNFTTTC
jgi:hypothetical protein